MGKGYRDILELKWVKVLGILALAFAFSMVMVQPFSISTATLLSSNDRSDFSITDFYNIVANSRKVRTYEQDIAIINIDRCDRQDIATILSLLNDCEVPPRAIGMDVIFEQPHEDDSMLLAEIERTPNLVLANVLAQRPDKSTFRIEQKSFFADEFTDKSFGAVNLPAKYAKSVIRRFPVDFAVEGKSGLTPSFAKAVAMMADSAIIEQLGRRGTKTELINFPSVEFMTIEPEELLGRLDELSGKVVLIGALNDDGDSHATPMSPRMSGVEIHAHAIRTILRNDYLDPLSDWQNWMIGIVLALLMIWLSVTIPVGIKGLVLRVIQFSLLFVIIPVGYYFFVDHNLSIDFTYAFLMVTFSLFAADVWIGLSNMPKIVSPYINKYCAKMKTFFVFAKRTFLVVLLVTLGNAFCQAKYTLHKYEGRIIVERRGQQLELQRGMELLPMDKVEIGNDAEIEILNSIDSRVYTSVRPGSFTINRILIDAEAHSKDNASNLFGNLSIKRSTPSAEVYEDKGVVSRTLVIYDPENENKELDCHKLGAALLHWLNDTAGMEPRIFPIEMCKADTIGPALSFEFVNTLDFPVYFNVVKVMGDGSRDVEISDLGQPLGCYVLPPNQTIMRSMPGKVAEGEKHMLLMTHYYYDIDKLILCVNELLESPLGVPEAPTQNELPRYVFPLLPVSGSIAEN